MWVTLTYFVIITVLATVDVYQKILTCNDNTLNLGFYQSDCNLENGDESSYGTALCLFPSYMFVIEKLAEKSFAQACGILCIVFCTAHLKFCTLVALPVFVVIFLHGLDANPCLPQLSSFTSHELDINLC